MLVSFQAIGSFVKDNSGQWNTHNTPQSYNQDEIESHSEVEQPYVSSSNTLKKSFSIALNYLKDTRQRTFDDEKGHEDYANDSYFSAPTKQADLQTEENYFGESSLCNRGREHMPIQEQSFHQQYTPKNRVNPRKYIAGVECVNEGRQDRLANDRQDYQSSDQFNSESCPVREEDYFREPSTSSGNFRMPHEMPISRRGSRGGRGNETGASFTSDSTARYGTGFNAEATVEGHHNRDVDAGRIIGDNVKGREHKRGGGHTTVREDQTHKGYPSEYDKADMMEHVQESHEHKSTSLFPIKNAVAKASIEEQRTREEITNEKIREATRILHDMQKKLGAFQSINQKSDRSVLDTHDTGTKDKSMSVSSDVKQSNTIHYDERAIDNASRYNMSTDNNKQLKGDVRSAVTIDHLSNERSKINKGRDYVTKQNYLDYSMDEKSDNNKDVQLSSEDKRITSFGENEDGIMNSTRTPSKDRFSGHTAEDRGGVLKATVTRGIPDQNRQPDMKSDDYTRVHANSVHASRNMKRHNPSRHNSSEKSKNLPAISRRRSLSPLKPLSQLIGDSHEPIRQKRSQTSHRHENDFSTRISSPTISGISNRSRSPLRHGPSRTRFDPTRQHSNKNKFNDSSTKRSLLREYHNRSPLRHDFPRRSLSPSRQVSLKRSLSPFQQSLSMRNRPLEQSIHRRSRSPLKHAPFRRSPIPSGSLMSSNPSHFRQGTAIRMPHTLRHVSLKISSSPPRHSLRRRSPISLGHRLRRSRSPLRRSPTRRTATPLRHAPSRSPKRDVRQEHYISFLNDEQKIGDPLTHHSKIPSPLKHEYKRSTSPMTKGVTKHNLNERSNILRNSISPLRHGPYRRSPNSLVYAAGDGKIPKHGSPSMKREQGKETRPESQKRNPSFFRRSLSPQRRGHGRLSPSCRVSKHGQTEHRRHRGNPPIKRFDRRF